MSRFSSVDVPPQVHFAVGLQRSDHVLRHIDRRLHRLVVTFPLYSYSLHDEVLHRCEVLLVLERVVSSCSIVFSAVNEVPEVDLLQLFEAASPRSSTVSFIVLPVTHSVRSLRQALPQIRKGCCFVDLQQKLHRVEGFAGIVDVFRLRINLSTQP